MGPALTPELAAAMGRSAVANVEREYPNAPALTLRSVADLRPPREVHPAFFGSYDWHSSVHQHWLLVRLLSLGFEGAAGDAARAVLDRSLTAKHLEIEAAYLRDHPAFERTYGWAWVLALAGETERWPDPVAARFRAALAPLVEVVRAHWLGYLARATYPIRAGTHANTAFGLALAIDFARGAGDASFEGALAGRASDWFAADRGYPAHLEPSGEDFLSGALMEAALLARLVDGPAFAAWFSAFLPEGSSATLREPAVVADRADPRLVHLDGLNLSRAWCWRTIGRALRLARPSEARTAEDAADVHLAAALPHLSSGEYVGEHWLGTFAVLALTEGITAKAGDESPMRADG